MSDPTEGDLRVWWIPQIPMKMFHVPVDSLKEAKKILATLADYDQFQLDNNIKPDYCNAGGLHVFEDGDWCDWESADGDDIDSIELDGEPYAPSPECQAEDAADAKAEDFRERMNDP
jgi:hypothetical protein